MNKYGHRSHLVDWGFGFSLDFAGSGLATITHPLRMSKLSLTIALLYCVGCYCAALLRRLLYCIGFGIGFGFGGGQSG